MGVEYWIADKGKKIYYWLGKGPWSWGGDDFMFAISDLEYLTEALVELWIDSNRWRNKGDDDGEIEYVKGVAKQLHEHFGSSIEKDLVCIHDGGDELTFMKCKGYRCVGSRYLDDTHDYNRHLADLKHLYPEDHGNEYAGFDEW